MPNETPEIQKAPKLTSNENQALKAWEDCDPDFCFISFKAVENRSGLPGYLVRRTVRALARKGVLKFLKGLWTDEGDPAGAGYGPTELGWAILASKAQEA